MDEWITGKVNLIIRWFSLGSVRRSRFEPAITKRQTGRPEDMPEAIQF
jgi:hypothetical protein